MNFSFGILKLVSYEMTFDPMCRDHLYYHSLHHFSMILVLSVVYWVLGPEWGEGGHIMVVVEVVAHSCSF